MKTQQNIINICLSCAFILAFIFNIYAQTKPRVMSDVYINTPPIQRDNPKWNSSTKEQKINILEKEVFPQDSIWYNHKAPPWICDNFAIQTLIDYNGYHPYLDTLKDSTYMYSIKNNGKYKIPTLLVTLTAKNGEAHSINAIFVGDTLKNCNFNDWYFFDNSLYTSSSKKVYPGHSSMNMNNTIKIFSGFNFSNGLPRGRPDESILIFTLTNGIVTNTNIDSTYLVMKNPIYDSVAPEIKPVIQNNSLNLDIKDDYSFLDSASYKIDNDSTQNIPCSKDVFIYSKPVYSISQSIPLPKSLGLHTIEITATDIAGNKKDTSFSYNSVDINEKNNLDFGILIILYLEIK